MNDLLGTSAQQNQTRPISGYRIGRWRAAGPAAPLDFDLDVVDGVAALDLKGDGLPREVLTKNCIFLLLVRAGGSQDGRVRTTEQERKQTKTTGGCLRLGSGSRM